MTIDDWFKNKDYDKGVALYEELEKNPKSNTLRSLKRGRSNRNMSLLIRNLRQLNDRVNTPNKNVVSAVSRVKKEELPSTNIDVVQEIKNEQIKEEATKQYFVGVRYGSLPKTLKIRYRQLKDLFYDRCDLKFKLNDLPDAEEKKALKLQKKIFWIASQQDQIWKEIDHWQEHKTLLPSNTDDDFSDLEMKDLFLKKASFESSIYKFKKRIEGYREALEAESDKSEKVKINQQINRSTRNLHEKELNLQKILHALKG